MRLLVEHRHPAAETLVAEVPSRLTIVLAAADGDERHPTLNWSVTSYVSHIGDNLRIWAERLAGITLGGSPAVASYNENALGAARAYDAISLPAALWSLQRSTRDWPDAVQMTPPDLAMIHPERGTIRLDNIIRNNAHDATHHVGDIERSLQA
jgi:hypothetical protein